MTPVSTSRKSVRHHYYVSRLNPGEDRKSAWRIPVGELDLAVLGVAAQVIREQAADRHDIAAIDAFASHAERLPSMIIAEQRKQLMALGIQVGLFTNRLEVTMPERPTITVAIKLTVRGNERRILVDGERPMREPDEALTKLVALAFATRASILSGEPDPLVDRFSDRHRARLLRVSFLAPDMIAAILEGNHPPSLTTRTLLTNAAPLDWKAQRKIARG